MWKIKKKNTLWFLCTQCYGFYLKISSWVHVLNSHLLSSLWRSFKSCGVLGRWSLAGRSSSLGVGSWKFVPDPGSNLFTGLLVSCSFCHVLLLWWTPSCLPSYANRQPYNPVSQNKHIPLKSLLSSNLFTATRKVKRYIPLNATPGSWL